MMFCCCFVVVHACCFVLCISMCGYPIHDHKYAMIIIAASGSPKSRGLGVALKARFFPMCCYLACTGTYRYRYRTSRKRFQHTRQPTILHCYDTAKLFLNKLKSACTRPPSNSLSPCPLSAVRRDTAYPPLVERVVTRHRILASTEPRQKAQLIGAHIAPVRRSGQRRAPAGGVVASPIYTRRLRVYLFASRGMCRCAPTRVTCGLWCSGGREGLNSRSRSDR